MRAVFASAAGVVQSFRFFFIAFAFFQRGGVRMSNFLTPTILLLREGTDTSQGVPQIISNINACAAVVDVKAPSLSCFLHLLAFAVLREAGRRCPFLVLFFCA